MKNYLIIILLYINTVSCQVSKDNLIGNDFDYLKIHLPGSLQKL